MSKADTSFFSARRASRTSQSEEGLSRFLHNTSSAAAAAAGVVAVEGGAGSKQSTCRVYVGTALAEPKKKKTHTF